MFDVLYNAKVIFQNKIYSIKLEQEIIINLTTNLQIS